MDKKILVTLDGPAGTGKGSIGKIVANYLKIKYLDTGLYYRAVSYLIIKDKLRNMESILKAAEDMKLEFIDEFTLLNGDKLSIDLRTREIDDIVGEVSLIEELRPIINKKIRDKVGYESYIVDGRDCGSIIFPNADIKVYLTCDVETRARRRYEQDLLLGINNDLDNIRENIKKRDEIDKNRKFGALKVPNDAIILDTSGQTLEESVMSLMKIIEGEKL